MKNRPQKAGRRFHFKCGHRGTLPTVKGDSNKFAVWYSRAGFDAGWGCRNCSYKRTLEWRKKNIKSYLYSNAKSRAKIFEVKFSIRLEDVPDVPKFCPIFPWIKLKSGLGKGRVASPNAPSIDRIKPIKGYVLGNIRTISHRANMLRNNMTTKELKALLVAN